MTTASIDKAEVIRQAATLAASAYIESMPKPKAFTKADHKTITGLIGDDLSVALPVIAKALLAPLRELIGPDDYIGRGIDADRVTIHVDEVRTLLDAIEAEVQP